MGDAVIDMQRVFLYTGKIAHLIDPSAPPAPGVSRDRQPTLCNFRPIWPAIWFGMNGDAEIAASMPMCRVCESVMEAQSRESA